MMSLVMMTLALLVVTVALVLSFAIDIHGIISTLSESILLLTIVCDHSTEYSALVVFGDTSNDNAIGTWGLAIVDLAVLLNGKLEIWLVSMAEGEFLIVVVSVRVYMCGQSAALWIVLGI